MKNFTRIAALLLSIAIIFGFTGCPSPVTEPTPTTEPTPETPNNQEQSGEDDSIPEEYRTPLTFEAIKDGQIVITYPWSTLKYSIDGGEKQAVNAEVDQHGDLTATITVQANQKVSFYADGSENDVDEDYIQNFRCAGENTEAYFYIYGNVMSLLDSTNFRSKTDIDESFAFSYLFSDGYVRWTNHPEKDIILPATSLKPYCYAGMFDGCESMERAPELPASNLAEGCYSEMFHCCYNLTEAPALPATTLVERCYFRMFDGCDSLTRAPDLPAATLVTSCYESMFEGCENLAYVKCLATDITAEDCTSDWLNSVADTGTFVRANGVEWSRNESGIPSTWSEETLIPEYSISCSDSLISLSKTSAMEGEEITISVNNAVSSGIYAFSVTKNNSNEEIQVSGSM